ncbi:MAG: YraN family protein, partial [Nitrospirae bacterium]
MKHLITGKEGEDFAVRFLKKRGLKVIERNYRTPIGEIDIVARDGRDIVIVEVKTRKGLEHGHPLEAVDARKQHKLRRLAQFYMKTKGLTDVHIRFDVLGLIKEADGYRVS